MSELLNKRVGDYELVRRVGVGGQASVYMARCCVDGKPGVARGQHVALKVLLSGEEGKKSDRRFRRQVETFRSLDHPHIVRYIDSFILQDEMGDERRCLVMEFLDGMELKDFMRKHSGGLPWPQLKRVFAQCLDGLAYACGKGIIHRDIKPSNIFLMRDGTAKLIDFGIARRQDATVTATTGFKGTFDYMAPDFLQEGADFRGDEQSDIFSFGICFVEALTGSLPYASVSDTGSMGYLNRYHKGGFEGPDVTAKHYRVFNEWCAHVVERCLKRDRSQRYATFAEMLADFQKIEPLSFRAGSNEYVFTEYMGKGKLAEIYRAVRKNDKKIFAVKRLLQTGEPLCFRREGRKLEKFPHANMVGYEDCVEVETGRGREEFLVLEFLENVAQWSLRARIDKKGVLEPREALHQFALYLSALEYLHEGQLHPIVHGDLSPLTLYCPSWDPRHPSAKHNGKLLDLGVEYRDEGREGRLKPTDPNYMAPEFEIDATFRGSPQSDVYAVGLCLYEALCGQPAYPPLPEDPSARRDAMAARADGRISVHFENPIFTGVPELARILARALSYDPDARYESAAAMRRDVELACLALPDESFVTTASGKAQPDSDEVFVPEQVTLDEAPMRIASVSSIPERKPFPVNAAAIAAGLAAVMAVAAIWYFWPDHVGPVIREPFFTPKASYVAILQSRIEQAQLMGAQATGADAETISNGLVRLRDDWSRMPERFEAVIEQVLTTGTLEHATSIVSEWRRSRTSFADSEMKMHEQALEHMEELVERGPREVHSVAPSPDEVERDFAAALDRGDLTGAESVLGKWRAIKDKLPAGEAADHAVRAESMDQRLAYSRLWEQALRQELSDDYAGRLEACIAGLAAGRARDKLPAAKRWWDDRAGKLHNSMMGLANLTAAMLHRHLEDRQDVPAAERVAQIWRDICKHERLTEAMPAESAAAVPKAASDGIRYLKQQGVAVRKAEAPALAELAGISSEGVSAGDVLARIGDIPDVSTETDWKSAGQVLADVVAQMDQWSDSWKNEELRSVEAAGTERLLAIADACVSRAETAYGKGDFTGGRSSEDCLGKLAAAAPDAFGKKALQAKLMVLRELRARKARGSKDQRATLDTGKPSNDPLLAKAVLPPDVKQDMAQALQSASDGESKLSVSIMCGRLVEMCGDAAAEKPESVVWSDLLDWVHRMRKAYSGLDEVGKSRLDWLESKIERYVKQQDAWLELLTKLKSATGKAERAAAIDTFTSIWSASPYRDAANRLK